MLFPDLAIENSTAVNIGERDLFKLMFLGSLNKYLREELLAHMAVLFLYFFISYCFPETRPIYIPVNSE